MRISAINATNFNGIYKLKTSRNEETSHRVEDFLSERPEVLKISIPFKENDKTYYYTITRDDKLNESLFEKALSEAQIPYWKAGPLRHIGSKELLDKIFEADRLLQGKESWVRPN